MFAPTDSSFSGSMSDLTDRSESVYDEFVSKLTKAVGNFKVGDGSSAGVYVLCQPI